MQHFRLEAVAPGAYAAISIHGTGSVGNAGFVDLGGSTVVFDTFLTPQAAEALRAEAERVAPVRWVVNSHAHGDHIRGNMAFPGAPIISTERTRELIVENALPQLERMKATPVEEALAEAEDDDDRATILQIADSIDRLEQRVPDVTFAERLTLHGADGRAHLTTFGGGHTPSDAILWLPDVRVCFAGDLVVIETHPTMGHGDAEQWLVILERIEALEPAVIVPGHGRVGTARDVEPLRAYLASMLADHDRPPEPGWTWPQVHARNAELLRTRGAALSTKESR